MKNIAIGVESLSLGNGGATTVEWAIVRVNSVMAKLIFRIPDAVHGAASAEQLRDALLACPQVQKACKEHQLTCPMRVDYALDYSVMEDVYAACVFTTPRTIDWWGLAGNAVVAVGIGLAAGVVAAWIKNK